MRLECLFCYAKTRNTYRVKQKTLRGWQQAGKDIEKINDCNRTERIFFFHFAELLLRVTNLPTIKFLVILNFEKVFKCIFFQNGFTVF